MTSPRLPRSRRAFLALLTTAALAGATAFIAVPIVTGNTISPPGCDTNGLALNISRAPNPVYAGGTITYSNLQVTNTAVGACDVTGATLTLTLPNVTNGTSTGVVILLDSGANYPAGSTTNYPNQTFTVPANPTFTTATAEIAETGGLLHDSEDVDDIVNISKTVSVGVVNPSTSLTVVGTAPTSAGVGTSVTLTVSEKNTSSDGHAIHGISVTGSPCATWTADAGNTDPLAAGASDIFTCTFTMPATTVNWSALGHGTDFLDKAVPATGESQEGSITPSVTPHTALTVVGTAPTSAVVGSSVTITVSEKNTSGDGNPIHNISVTGSPCATWVGDAGNTDPLADGASDIFTCTFTMPATTVNWSATGHGLDLLGGTVPGAGETQEGSITPSVTPHTTLTVVGTAPTTATIGSSVTITVSEKNTSGDGNPIHNISVTGSPCATWVGDAGNTDPLADGASDIFTCTFTMPATTVNWSATGHGLDLLGGTVPGAGETQEGSVAPIVTPHTALSIVGSVPATVPAGTSVTITVSEKNTSGDGNPIHNISVTGSPCATWTAAAGNTDPLADGASDTFTCTFTVNSTVNWSATGHGLDINGQAVPGAGEHQEGTINVTPTGLIAPTNTTCQQFLAGTPALPGINYSVSNGKIGQNINPGVFFYFSLVTVAPGSTPLTVTTSQSNTSGAAPFLLNQGHAFVWDANCNKVGNMTPTNGGATGTFVFNTAGTYILQLQYSTKSIAGTAAPNPANPTYSFDTNGVVNASIQLFKQ